MNIHTILGEMVREMKALSDRVRALETSTSLTPIRYTIANCTWLTADASQNDTDIYVAAIPEWVIKNVATFDITVDAGDVAEEEAKSVKSFYIDPISGRITLSLTTALAHDHSKYDPVAINNPYI